MALPKTTQERISNDAAKYHQKILRDWHRGAVDYAVTDYIAGATVENERAQKLAEALEKIANNTAWQNWQAQEIAKSALQQWNAGKEVGDEIK